jgi:DhnA family fructose-bisphosphate aldolase class Ia
VTAAAKEILARLTEIRATDPEAIGRALAKRRRRPMLERNSLFLVAADHAARGVLKVGSDPMAMADRGELLQRLLTALSRPGVDGILGTAEIIEDLALLGALDGKVVFGSMNRGGLTGFRFELDDRFTAYTVDGIVAAGLDGGKMMVRVADEPEALRTLAACAHAINELSAHKLPAMIEVFASEVEDGRVRNRADADSLIRAITVVSGLGTTSAYLWLKLPVVDDLARVMRATSLPTLLLGGDPGEDPQATFARWEQAMAIPQVRGLVAGRTLLYPKDGDVAGAVDAAAAIVASKSPSPARGAG